MGPIGDELAAAAYYLDLTFCPQEYLASGFADGSTVYQKRARGVFPLPDRSLTEHADGDASRTHRGFRIVYIDIDGNSPLGRFPAFKTPLSWP